MNVQVSEASDIERRKKVNVQVSEDSDIEHRTFNIELKANIQVS